VKLIEGLTPDEREHLERVARELRFERYGPPASAGELGAPIIPDTPICFECGAYVTLDNKNRLVHMGPTSCHRVVVDEATLVVLGVAS